MKKINNELVNEVSAKAKTASRKRINFNFHETASDTMHRMLNALEPDTYVRPHKHENPDKREAFIIIRGSILVVLFDIRGRVVDHIILNHEKGNYGTEIPPRAFHTIIALEPSSVLYEIKDGPYDVSNDKGFAEWAPAEGAPEAINYLNDLILSLGLMVRYK